jgi:ribosomal protein L40E
MVSSEEMRKRLDAKRSGVKTPDGPESEKFGQETVICPECQTQNPTTAKFCVGCGAPMVKEETPIDANTETLTEETEDFKMCPSCNQKNKPNAKFCIICGHKFEDSTDGDDTAETVSEEEDSFPSAQEVLESSPEELNSETGTDESIETTSDEPVEIVTDESIETISDDLSAEETKNASIPEIKVPEDLKAEKNEETIVEEEPEAQETKMAESAEDDVDPVEKIKKAKELLDIGAITQEEFDNIKNKYLGQI